MQKNRKPLWPFVLSLSLHLLLMLIFAIGLHFDPTNEAEPQPEIIQATLIEELPIAPETKASKAPAKKPVKDKEEPVVEKPKANALIEQKKADVKQKAAEAEKAEKLEAVKEAKQKAAEAEKAEKLEAAKEAKQKAAEAEKAEKLEAAKEAKQKAAEAEKAEKLEAAKE
ncbi:MAG: protein TolA, partial [Methylococcales bacterium]